MKKLYYFYFYILFRFWEEISIPKFWSDVKALISLCFIELLFIISFIYYTESFFSKLGFILFCILAIIIPNSYLFLYKDEWHVYGQMFEKFSKEEKKYIYVLLLILTIFIIANFIFSLIIFLR